MGMLTNTSCAWPCKQIVIGNNCISEPIGMNLTDKITVFKIKRCWLAVSTHQQPRNKYTNGHINLNMQSGSQFVIINTPIHLDAVPNRTLYCLQFSGIQTHKYHCTETSGRCGLRCSRGTCSIWYRCARPHGGDVVGTLLGFSPIFHPEIWRYFFA